MFALPVLDDVRLAAGLAEGVVAVTAEALRQEGVLVQPALAVAVGMDPARLREDELAHEGLVRGDPHAGNRFHIPAHVHQAALIQGVLHLQVVVEDADGAGHGQVAGPLPQPVHGRVQALDAGANGLEGVRRGEVVVVVGMEVEMDARIAFHHRAAELPRAGRIQDAQGVGQHDPLHGRVLQGVHQEEHVVRRVGHPVGPVLEVHIHLHSFRNGDADVPEDVVQVLLRGFPQLGGHVAEGALRQQVHHLSPGGTDPVHGQAAVHEAERLHGAELPASGSPGADLGESLLLAAGNPRRGHLDPVDLQFLQEQARDGQLLVRVERDAGGLLAVTQGGVQDFDHRFS